MNIERRIMKARAHLMLTQPFFGCLAMHLKLVEDTTYDTLATDGDHLYYNPGYVEGISDAQLAGVVAHEVMHIAMDHITRRGHRKMGMWNKACDLAINGQVLAHFELPDEPHHDPDLDGLSAEEIYRGLSDNEDDTPSPDGGQDQQGQDNRPGADPSGCGAVLDAAPAHDQAALDAVRQEMKTRVQQARMIARKKEGELSADTERLIDKMLEPQVDWRALFRDFIDARIVTDFSWMHPNRRLIDQGIYLPGIVPDGTTHVVLAVDTSGSIDEAALNAFSAEIKAAFEDGAVEKLTVVYADTDVKGHAVFEAGDDFALKPIGGGGTAFDNTFQWIEEHADDAVAVIYFTDLKCSRFGKEPHCPTLWAVWGDSREFDKLSGNTPFGEALAISVTA